MLRRTESFNPSIPEIQEDYIYKIDDLILNDFSKTVTRNGETISLTTTEFKLLLNFLQNLNKVLSRGEILDNVWGVNFDMGTNVVDVYVNYLRKKIDSNSSNKLIHTVIGMGYVMKEN